VKLKNRRRAKLTSAALVGLSGIGEAVADHDLSLIECRLNHFGNGLRAVGKHQCHFGHGRQAGLPRIEHQGADAVTGFSSAGLACDDRVLVWNALLEPCGQTPDLRRLA